MPFRFENINKVTDILKQAAFEKEARALAAEDRMYKQRANELNYQKGLEELNQLQRGMGSSIPNAVSEYNYFKSLSKPEQDAYLLVKRNPSQFNLGGQIGVGYDPYTGGFNNVYNKTAAPRVAIDAVGNPVMLGGVGGQNGGNQYIDRQTDAALNDLSQTVAQDSIMGRQQNNAPALPSMPAQGNMGQAPVNQGMAQQQQSTSIRSNSPQQEQFFVEDIISLPNGKKGYKGRVYNNALSASKQRDFDIQQAGKMKDNAKKTEDQGKATVWLQDALVNYQDMINAMFDESGRPTGAENPYLLDYAPIVSRDPARGKFKQASESLSEKLLRASTGAGITKDETKQKVKEIVPQYWDSDPVKKQKIANLPSYIKSLAVRANEKNIRIPIPMNNMPPPPAGFEVQ
jgi:hypothetical protein